MKFSDNFFGSYGSIHKFRCWCCRPVMLLWEGNCLFGCKSWKLKLKGLYFAARFCFSFSFNFGIDFFDKARWKPNYFQRLCLWHKRNDAISFWLLFLISDEKMHFGKSDAANHLILFYVKDSKQELHQKITVGLACMCCSMTQLLSHTFAHLTGSSSRLKAKLLPIKNILGVKYNWVNSVKKWPSF